MNAEYEIISLSARQELIPEAAVWFASKWGIAAEEYEESMRQAAADESAAVPNWYVVTDECGAVIAGAGVIENDFHDRTDLTPNLCALFVEERYRRRGIAPRLLGAALAAARAAGIKKLYLVTEHENLYERYGWRHIAYAAGGDGAKMRVYESPEA